MTPEEIQGYLLILSPLAISIVAMSIFTLQDKSIKTYTLGEIAKDRSPKITPGNLTCKAQCNIRKEITLNGKTHKDFYG